MAYDIAIDVGTNDLVLQNGDLLLVDNAERVSQQILITLKFWESEWFLNENDGVPYLDYIFVKNPNIAHVRQIITEKIKSVTGVQSVTALDLKFDAQRRLLTIIYGADTDYGLLTEEVILGYGRGTD